MSCSTSLLEEDTNRTQNGCLPSWDKDYVGAIGVDSPSPFQMSQQENDFFSYYSSDEEKLMKRLDTSSTEDYTYNNYRTWSPICSHFNMTPGSVEGEPSKVQVVEEPPPTTAKLLYSDLLSKAPSSPQPFLSKTQVQEDAFQTTQRKKTCLRKMSEQLSDVPPDIHSNIEPLGTRADKQDDLIGRRIIPCSVTSEGASKNRKSNDNARINKGSSVSGNVLLERTSRSASREKSGVKVVLNNQQSSQKTLHKKPVRINNNLHVLETDVDGGVDFGQKNSFPCDSPTGISKTSAVERKSSVSRKPVNANGVVNEKISKGESQRKPQSKKRKRCTVSGVDSAWLPIVSAYLRKWAGLLSVFLCWFFYLVMDLILLSSRHLWHLIQLALPKCQHAFKLVYVWSIRMWLKLASRLGRKSETQLPTGTHKLPLNIDLPATGEDAMKRLLACKDKDPYSIIGVSRAASDEDIKKYYRRQAVLVHPDKNPIPGAEEAFKVLAHAFDLIGEPVKRQKYDGATVEAQQMESAWNEFADLLSKLQEKMEEAANTIHCTCCGKRHRRIKTDRPCYGARFCSACQTRHAARNGDIWAETTYLGFCWHYYACMDSAIFDITEWAACQSKNLQHMKANTHTVQYRIISNKKSAHTPTDVSSEQELDELLNTFYGNASTKDGSSGTSKQEQKKKKKNKKR